jgi:hypothetical protein
LRVEFFGTGRCIFLFQAAIYRHMIYMNWLISCMSDVDI